MDPVVFIGSYAVVVDLPPEVTMPCACCRRQQRIANLDADDLCRVCRTGEAEREREERAR